MFVMKPFDMLKIYIFNYKPETSIDIYYDNENHFFFSYITEHNLPKSMKL